MNRHSGSHLQSMPPGQAAPQVGQHRSRNSFGMSSGVPIPAGSATVHGNGPDRNGAIIQNPQSFDMARSPPNMPNNKNTKHVPCKFFRQGACQAGNACPFLHTMDPMSHQAPCKYFMKGNCKFGAKCALAHYLPNGHRVSKADLDPALAMNTRTYGKNETPFSGPDPSSNEAYLSTQGYPDYFGRAEIFPLEDEADAYNDRYHQYRNGAQFESNVNSPPISQFGSPLNENNFPKSPVENTRSALDAPLPASFNANSLPHIAKYGPFGQSVPDKFGMRSPPTSTLSQKVGSPPNRDTMYRSSNLGMTMKNTSSLAGSPANIDGSIGERIMHSQRGAFKPRIISASVPSHDWEEGLGLESDLLPSGLHDEVLTPQEKMRRLSRPDQELSSSARDRSEGLAIPRRGSGVVGSPPASGSPSRFRAIFEEQQREKTTAATSSAHIGSPLRESWMPNETAQPSTSRQGAQMSGISQAMARMELNRTESTESNTANASRSGAVPIATGLRSGFGRFDRTISSPGLPSKKIDEENEAIFFPMDTAEENQKAGASATGWTIGGPGKPPGNENFRGGGFGPGMKQKPVFGFHEMD